MCTYHHRGTTMECRGDGFLWDADDDGYDPSDKSCPCPQCNTKQYLESAKEQAEECSDGHVNGRSFTGESIWKGAVAVAEAANPTEAAAALMEIGIVSALVPDPSKPEGYDVRQYVYQ